MVVEKIGNLSVVSAAHSLTWHSLLRFRLGHPPLHRWPFLGLGHSFFPSVWSLPHSHDHRSYGSKRYQNSSCVADMFKVCPSAVTLTSNSLYHPTSSCILSSCVDDVGFIMALLRHSRFSLTSTHYPGSWPRDSLPVPYVLHALMASSLHLTTRLHHWLSIE